MRSRLPLFISLPFDSQLSRRTIGLAVWLSLGTLLPTIAQAQGHARATSPTPEKLVAEATISDVSGGMFKYVFLPVTIHGHAMTVILDLGASAGISLSSSAAAHWGTAIPDVLDSLAIGKSMEYSVSVTDKGFSKEVPSGMPPLAGLLGTKVLSHYDILFDGPARRVKLYLPAPGASADSVSRRSMWLPNGLTPADCAPMFPLGNPDWRFVGIPILASGKPIVGFFDSGAKRNNMDFSTAQVLGIDTTSPNVHSVPHGIPGAFPLASVSKEVWEVPNIPLVMGSHNFTDSHVFLHAHYSSFGADSPVIGLGLDAISTRLLFVSYSTGQVCLGERH